ncbi:hypothetical protein [Clostridium sp. DL1XJH146]
MGNLKNAEIKANLFNVCNVEGSATATEGIVPDFEEVEGAKGWSIATFSSKEIGIDHLILRCKENGEKFNLHSGGNDFWLGYVQEGSAELILGDDSGKQTSSKMVTKGDYVTFAPDTYHGWIPDEKGTKISFIKLKAKN